MGNFLKLTKVGHVTHKKTLVHEDKIVNINEYDDSQGGKYTEIQTDKGFVNVSESMEDILSVLDVKEVGVRRKFKTVEKANIQ